MRIRYLAALVFLLSAACGGSGPSGPPTVHDANSTRGGTVRVETGENLSDVARRTGVSIRDLVRANDLEPPYSLRPGQRLFVPSLQLHRVREGESISVIAERYGVGRFDLARLNGIGPPYSIFPRQILKIPGGGRTPAVRVLAADIPPPPPPRPAGLEGRAAPGERQATAPAPRASAPREPAPREPATAQPRRQKAARPAAGSRAMTWPVGGKVISTFGPKQGGLHNDGVNVAAPPGTPVMAAAAGRVVYAGNEVRSFGNLVLVRHDNGLTTAYAHLGRITVRKGQKVARGARLGIVGTSGGVSPAQLHFEIRRGRKALDPLAELGRPPAGRPS